MKRTALAAVTAMLLAGCGGGSGGAGSSSGSTGGGNAAQPHLSSIQQVVFTPSCALGSCHGGLGAQSGMDLSAGKSYASIVNVASQADPSMLRVKPGDSANSQLYLVLLGPSGHVPDRMPKGGDPLPQSSIDAIKSWIDSGAPND